MKKSYYSGLLVIVALLLLSACDNFANPSDGGNATIVIDLGNGKVPEKAAKDVNINELRHMITLSGPTGSQTHSITGGGTFRATVAAGTWNIRVTAYLGAELYAIGSATAEVRAGLSTDVIEATLKAYIHAANKLMMTTA